MKKHLLILIFISVLGFSFAQQTNYWTTIVGTQYNLTMSGVVYIDDVAQTSTALEIGAFCGDECRGSAHPQFFPPTGDYVVSLTVVSNQQSGEVITFRLYDHNAQQEFPTECVNSIVFNANDNYGEMGSWYPFAFVENTNTTQTVTLSAGWNWVSINVESDDPAELLQALEEGMDGEELIIKSRTMFTQLEYDEDEDEYYWDGSLESVGLEPGTMYMIYTDASCTVELEGTPASPSCYEFTLTQGWNWIPFPSVEAVDLEVALANFEPEEGDAIKTRAKFANYVYDEDEDEYYWDGSLMQLTPGEGLMFYSGSTEPRTLVFSSAAKGKRQR